MLPIPSRRVYTTFHERALQALCIEYVILISRVILDRYPCQLLAVADEKWPDLTPSRESFRREFGVRGPTFNLFEIDDRPTRPTLARWVT